MNLYLIVIQFNIDKAVTFFIAANSLSSAQMMATKHIHDTVGGPLSEISLGMAFTLPNCRYEGNNGEHIIQMQKI